MFLTFCRHKRFVDVCRHGQQKHAGRIRNSSFKAKILDNLKKFVFPFLEKGKIKCFIDSEYDLDNVINAHKRLYQGKHIGKVILKV